MYDHTALQWRDAWSSLTSGGDLFACRHSLFACGDYLTRGTFKKIVQLRLFRSSGSNRIQKIQRSFLPRWSVFPWRKMALFSGYLYLKVFDARAVFLRENECSVGEWELVFERAKSKASSFTENFRNVVISHWILRVPYDWNLWKITEISHNWVQRCRSHCVLCEFRYYDYEINTRRFNRICDKSELADWHTVSKQISAVFISTYSRPAAHSYTTHK